MELFRHPKTPIWGLTGGIGSGKSLAASFFQQAGISVINLDLLGKEILDKDPQVHKQLKNLFGDSILLAHQTPDKKKIREIVFSDSAKRVQLEELLHPRIWKEFERLAADEIARGAKLILCEAALLIEHHHAKLFPRLIVVMANTELRKKRVLARDQVPSGLVDQIVKSQVSDEERKQFATDLLSNEGTPQQLEMSVKKLISDWKQQSLI